MEKNPNGQEANRLAIYKRGRGFEDLNSGPRTENKSSQRYMNSGPPDSKFGALTAWPRRLLILHYSVLVKKYKKNILCKLFSTCLNMFYFFVSRPLMVSFPFMFEKQQFPAHFIHEPPKTANLTGNTTFLRFSLFRNSICDKLPTKIHYHRIQENQYSCDRKK